MTKKKVWVHRIRGPVAQEIIAVPSMYAFNDKASKICDANYKQGEKTAIRMEENNSKWSNWQTTNLKNIQATPTAQFQKNKWPNQKMGQRTK